MLNRILPVLLPLCAVSFLLFTGAQAPEKAHDRQRTRLLLQLSGAGEIGTTASKQMMEQMSQSMPDVPAAFWEEFEKEINAEALVELIIPIYEKHFTPGEIEELIAFYESPIGKKLTAKLPAIMTDSMAAGEKWGWEISAKAMQRLQESGQLPKRN